MQISPEVALDIEDANLIYNVKPAYRRFQEQKQLEEQMYHYPSAIPGLFNPDTILKFLWIAFLVKYFFQNHVVPFP